MRSRALGFCAVLFFLLVAPVFLAGCKSSSFVGKRYDNFTALYNTFYNARRSYRAGVKSQERRNDSVDRTEYIGVFIRSGPAGGGRDFEDAVLKSADVLRDHPESKWVDDALLVIGKSYFFQNNYVGAQQKFREVIDLGTGLAEEGWFWLARTHVASGDFERAELTITEALAGAVESREWVASLRLALGELRVKQGDWAGAAVDLSEGLDVVRDKEIAARASFLLGQVYETLGQYEEAVASYRRVRGYRPDYELDYAAQYSAIRVEGSRLDPDDALGRLRKMERDDKHFAYRGELALLRGDILRAMGRADDAYNVYDELLYDEVFAQEIGGLRGRIHYSLAQLYRDLDEDFVLAAAHFDTAASALRSGSSLSGAAVDPLRLSPEAIRNSQELKEAFGAFATAYREVHRMDSLLVLGTMDDSTFAVKVLELRRLRAEEMAERQRLQEERQIARAFQQTASSQGANRGLPAGKVIPSGNANGQEAGFLFHDDPVMRQEGQLSFTIRWGERARVPNWRRMEAVLGAGVQAGDLAGEEEEVELLEDQLPEVDLSAVPRDSTSQADMKANRALARYDVGNTLFLGIERPDSAAVWYRMVLEDTPDEPVARRALFALAEIQRALGDSSAANGIYQRILIDYPDTEFASRIRALLGVEEDQDLGPDSLAQAEAYYARFFDVWEQDQHAEALNGMLETAGLFPTTSILPKAIFAAGSVYLDWVDPDSLSADAPLPIGVADSLLVRAGLVAWPDTTTATAVDSTTATADSTWVDGLSPDSLAGVPSSAEVDMDELTPAAADSTLTTDAAPADSMAALPPGIRAMADTTDVPASESDSVVVDSAAVASLAVASLAVDSLAVDSLAVASASIAAVAAELAAADAELAGADSTSQLAPADSTIQVTGPEIAFVEPEALTEPERPWNEVTLRRLMESLTGRFNGTRYATAAGQLLKAIDDMAAEKQAVFDSIRVALEAAERDSLAVLVADSLAMAESLAAMAPDSFATAGADSLAIAGADSTGSGVPVKGVPRLSETVVDNPAQPDSVSVPNRPIGMPGARDVEMVSVADMPIVRSADAMPAENLQMAEEEEERPATRWSGWTIVLSEVRDLETAREVRDNLVIQLGQFGKPEIWVGTWRRSSGIVVAIGRLDSDVAARDLARRLGARLPQDAWILHIIGPQN